MEIVTEPEDVIVYINGQPWGRTPLKIIGKLPEGRHHLELRKANYNGIEKTIFISPHKTEKVFEKMTKGFGNIQIVTKPHNANIVINGKRIGLAPTKFIKFESGMTLKIELTHAETHPKTFTTELVNGEKKIQNVELEYRPTYLSVFANTKGASIFLDDEMISYEAVKNKRITANKEYSLKIQKEGYLTHEEIILLKGGQEKTFSITLKKE